MIQAERVLVSCVIENREPFIKEAEYLFKSLRHFGGNLAYAQCAAYFIGSADPKVVDRLADLDVSIKVVNPIDARCPHANKIQMLDDTREYDYLVALDTDTVIVRDFSDYLTGDAIAAKPVDGDPLTLDQWKSLFSYFGLELPSARYLTTFALSETIPYFNSGVLVIPRQHVFPLYEAWRSWVIKLLDAYAKLPDIAVHAFFTDQFALSLALASTKLPYRSLPLEMNFPTHHPVHAAFKPEQLTPYILHYHHRFSPTWEILPCSYQNVNKLIDELNQVLTAPMVSPSIFNKISQRYWGWHTTHFSRPWEYQWVIKNLEARPGLSILDAGAGRSPLPLYLAERGMKVITVDNGSPNEPGEWGYVDYSCLHPNITSYNKDFKQLPWIGDREIDRIVSVSVIEHLTAQDRRLAWQEFARVIKPNGRLILTIDLHKDWNHLWNYCRGVEVEPLYKHGTLLSIIDELRQVGFILCESQRCPLENSDKVRVMGLVFVKTSSKDSKDSFDNREFWGNRYKTNLKLGSGLGSCGVHLQYKKELLRRVLEKYQPRSILDVGCGDLEVIKELEFSGTYIGIDISPTIIERNKMLKPSWTFIAGEFLDIIRYNSLSADLVICLDVLIHQHSYKTYLEFVQALVRTTNIIGLISGFEMPPLSNFRSEIVAYHEPLTRTLQKVGIRDIKIVGYYRDTWVILFSKGFPVR